MFDAYGKDPRVDADAEVTVDEVAEGYATAEGLVGSQSDAVYYESVVAVSHFEPNQLAELKLYPIEFGRSKRFANRECRGSPPLRKQEPFWSGYRSSRSHLGPKST
ncbi:hypothetical protein [Mesorhizobium sp. M0045]|uniref:hypothetical protein n=1 Tax=Mesorhizobium sp. M0045 TaxID=2956857 RepID=UPI003339B7F0